MALKTIFKFSLNSSLIEQFTILNSLFKKNKINKLKSFQPNFLKLPSNLEPICVLLSLKVSFSNDSMSQNSDDFKGNNFKAPI